MTKEDSRHIVIGSKIIRGLSSFEARAIALVLLLFLVFPTMSQASSETPEVVVKIVSGNSTIRGSEILITALVSGTPGNVSLRWILPTGFESVNETLMEESKVCEFLPCERKITVYVNASTRLGPHDVGVEAEYA